MSESSALKKYYLYFEYYKLTKYDLCGLGKVGLLYIAEAYIELKHIYNNELTGREKEIVGPLPKQYKQSEFLRLMSKSV